MQIAPMTLAAVFYYAAAMPGTQYFTADADAGSYDSYVQDAMTGGERDADPARQQERRMSPMGAENAQPGTHTLSPRMEYFDAEGDPMPFEAFVRALRSRDYAALPLEPGQYQLTSPSDSRRLEGVRIAGYSGRLAQRADNVEITNITAPGHLLIPITVIGSDATIQGVAIFDTGTFIPFIPAPGVREEAGRIEALESGAARFEGFSIGEIQRPQMIEGLNAQYADVRRTHYDGAPIVGIVGANIFGGAAYTIDVAGGRIVTGAPVQPGAISAPYNDHFHNVWIEATVNGEPGHIHLDSGYPFSWIEADLEGEASLVIGGHDLTEAFDAASWRRVAQSHNYPMEEVTVLAGFSTATLADFILTVVPDEKRVYISPAPASGP